MEYFPPGIFDDKQKLNEFKNLWYGGHLIRMREQPLYPPAIDQPQTFRLLLIPSFHRPILVRLTALGQGWRIVSKQDEMLRDLPPDPLPVFERDMSAAEITQFNDLLTQTFFWEMETREINMGLDGFSTILEGRKDGKYHIIERWCPANGPFAGLVGFLISLCNEEWHVKDNLF